MKKYHWNIALNGHYLFRTSADDFDHKTFDLIESLLLCKFPSSEGFAISRYETTTTQTFIPLLNPNI